MCPNCSRPVTGRSDKRFCCSECRTMFNNRRYRRKHREIERIDRILKKNRSIIDRLYNEGCRTTSVHLLHRMGFEFRYMTSFAEDTGGTGQCVLGYYDYSCTLSRDGNVVIGHTEITPL